MTRIGDTSLRATDWRMKSAASVILAVLYCASYAPAQQASCSGNPQQQGKAYPLEVISNKPFVEARVNGSRPLTFILDTGAPWGMLEREVAPTLGFRPSGEGIERGAGQRPSRIAPLTPAACIQIADAFLANATLRTLDFSEISTAEGRQVQGVIGGDFFSHHALELDYSKRSFRVWDESHEYHGRGTVIPVTVEAGHIYAKASLRTASGSVVEGKFMIDTGVRVSILLSRPFAAEQHILDRAFYLKGVTIGIGAGGETRGSVFRLPSIQLGPVRIDDVVAVASSDTAGVLSSPNFAGIIGGELLRRYDLILDYPHQRLIFETSPESNQPFSFDESGLFLVADGKDLKSVKVLRVLPNSPASEAQIQEGDLITSINEKQTTGMSLDEVRNLFRVSGTYSVNLRREGQNLETKLRTRDMLAASPANE